MFEETYNNLYEAEKTEFCRITNYLLSKTFVLRDTYDKVAKKMITSPEFLFVERYSDIFENYLELAGYKLNKDPIKGLYWIESMYDYNKVRFDSTTTYLLLAIMVIYAESTPQIAFGNTVMTTTYDIVNKLTLFNIITRKPSVETIRNSLRKLEQFNIILRLNASDNVDLWNIMIMPSILYIIDYELLKKLCDVDIPNMLNGITSESEVDKVEL